MNTFTYPNEAGTYNEWDCVPYTDISGADPPAMSRCEYQLTVAWLEDTANAEWVSSNQVQGISAYDEQCVFPQHSFWVEFAGILTVTAWVDYALCVKTYLNVEIAETG